MLNNIKINEKNNFKQVNLTNYKKPINIRNKYKVKKLLKTIKPTIVTDEDIPQMNEIYKTFWGTKGIYPDEEYKRIINQNLSYSYKNGGEIMAYCLLDYSENEKITEINLLCVKKSYQSCKLGELLLSFCIDNCCKLNYKKLCLHVYITNSVALGLYKKLGFEIKQTLPEYYKDEAPVDNDAYYMELDKS